MAVPARPAKAARRKKGKAVARATSQHSAPSEPLPQPPSTSTCDADPTDLVAVADPPLPDLPPLPAIAFPAPLQEALDLLGDARGCPESPAPSPLPLPSPPPLPLPLPADLDAPLAWGGITNDLLSVESPLEAIGLLGTDWIAADEPERSPNYSVLVLPGVAEEWEEVDSDEEDEREDVVGQQLTAGLWKEPSIYPDQ